MSKKKAGRAPAKKPSTALAVINRVEKKQSRLGSEVRRELKGLAAVLKAADPHKQEQVAPPSVLDRDRPGPLTGDDIDLGDLGLIGGFTLPPEAEKIFDEPVPIGEVLIKPSGGQIYLSHPSYTRWVNRAVGRGGWALRAVGKPRAGSGKASQSIVVPYVLYLKGQAAAFAWGEQEYHDENREQTYGDAVEATVASGLRRTLKRLGVGLELWERQWIRRFIREHCVKVNVKVRRWDKRANNGEGGYVEKIVAQWRRKVDDPFDDEVGPATEKPAAGKKSSTSRAPADDGTGGELIPPPMHDRLMKLVGRVGRSEREVEGWLAAVYKIGSMEIRRRDYDTICAAIERPGPLPSTREPGEEG